MKETEILKLINYLAQQKRYVGIEELCNHFKISRRTAFYRIKKANQLLTAKNITPIKNVRNMGYILNPKAIKAWQSYAGENTQPTNIAINKDIRIKKIIWRFLIKNDPVSIAELMDSLNISKNTVLSDFRLIRSNYPKLQLTSTSNGHTLAGSEEEKSRFVFNELQESNNGLISKLVDELKFPVISLKTSKQNISDLEKEILSHFTENAASKLIRALKFRIFRISMGNSITKVEVTKNDINESTVNIISATTNFLQKNGISGEDEILFFSELILCSQVDKVKYVKENFKNEIMKVAQDIVYRYSQISGVNIKSPKFIFALSNHLYASYFRCKFDFEFKTEALKKVEEKFPEMVKFVQLACSPLAKLIAKPIPINEVALICLYFISYNGISDDISHVLDKSDNIKESLQADVLLVCTSGVSSSAILYSNLHKRYPLITFSKSLSIEDLGKILRIPNTARLIITTAPLNDKEIDLPIVQVKSMMDHRDNVKVEKQLKRYFPQLSLDKDKTINTLVNLIKKSANITNLDRLKDDLATYLYPTKEMNTNQNVKYDLIDLLYPYSVQIINNFADKNNLEEIIMQLCENLEKQDVISSGYSKVILELIKKYGPYMLLSSNTFLAHAAPGEYTKKIGIQIGILKHPLKISINNTHELISCVVVLSPGFHHEHDTALAQLINVITDKSLFDQLMHVSNSRKAFELIDNFIR